MSSVDAVRTRLLRLKIFPDRVKILATRNTKRHEKVERDLRARLPARQKKTRSKIAFHPRFPRLRPRKWRHHDIATRPSSRLCSPPVSGNPVMNPKQRWTLKMPDFVSYSDESGTGGDSHQKHKRSREGRWRNFLCLFVLFVAIPFCVVRRAW